MPQRRPIKPREANPIRRLRLDAWRPIPEPGTDALLGSLRALLADFAPRPVPALAIPIQRSAPENAHWFR